MSSEGPSGSRAWGWVDHLVAGGTTAWCDWDDWGPARSRLLPGAQHLEVVRRLNLIAPVTDELAGTVLATSGSGRGQQDLDLVGVRDIDFGAPPVDPADIATDELVRVASGALADLVLADPVLADPVLAAPGLPAPPGDGTPAKSRRRLLRTRYRLVGDPFLAATYRDQLVAQGRRPGGRNPRVVVLLADYGTYLGDVWAAHARRGKAMGWNRWLGHLVGEDALPPRVDLLALTNHWATRVGRQHVHLAFGASEVAQIAGGSLQPVLRESWAALEAARVTSAGLRLVVDGERRQQLVSGVLLPWLREVDDPALPGPLVPRRHRAWVTREAVRIRDGLTAAGYPVPRAGLDRLLPDEAAPTAAPTAGPDDREVLSVMLRALHRGSRGAR